MVIQKVYAVYFSPTGATRSVVETMLAEFDIPKEVIDITPYDSRNNTHSFREDELVIVGVPVYSTRVPITAEERLKLLRGNNTPVVLVATYGGLHYVNALYEFQHIVSQNSFITIAAAAVVAEHNIVNLFPSSTLHIASGRPDAQDRLAISAFARQAYEKALQTSNAQNMEIRGKMPSTPRNKYPVQPYADKKCRQCGLCARQCPVQAIGDPRRQAGKGCLHCIRCIKYCPENARTYSKLAKIVVKQVMTVASRSMEGQSEYFL